MQGTDGTMTQKKTKSEANVSQQTRLDCSQEMGTVLFRNNVGAFKSPSGAWVRYGLANDSKAMNSRIKSSDLIGFTPVTITSEMVGSTVAVFTAIETKEEGYKPSGVKQKAHYEAQKRFCDKVSAKGGIAGIVDSSQAAVKLIKNWLQSFGE